MSKSLHVGHGIGQGIGWLAGGPSRVRGGINRLHCLVQGLRV